MTTDFSFQHAFESLTSKLAAVVFYAFDINGVAIPMVLIWLISGALVFTCYLGFINVRGFGHAIRLLKNNKRSSETGEITPFQALSTALSGTVGTGNIAGVAAAIGFGGPGAVFWMWAVALHRSELPQHSIWY